MSAALRFHTFIDKYNILHKPTEIVRDFLNNHRTFYKVVLVVNHIFRAVMMTALMLALPYSIPVKAAFSFSASLLYRLTVENNCAYKFALPAFAGSLALPIAKTALPKVINSVAFTSMKMFARTFSSFLPLIAYITYIVLTVSYDVDSRS